MVKRILGKSDLEVSSIGLGCMGMTHGFGGPADEKEMIKVIQGAYDAEDELRGKIDELQNILDELDYNIDNFDETLAKWERMKRHPEQYTEEEIVEAERKRTINLMDLKI